MVVDGDVEFEIGGQVYHPKPGEELFIPSGAVHSVRNIGRSTAHWLYGYRREGISLNHLEARVAFCVRLEAFAPGIRHFSPKPSFVNPVQIAADFATLQ